MVDMYQTGEPIPDGWVHIQLLNPIDPHIDYLDFNMMPANLEEEFNVRFYFRDMPNGWKETDHGIMLRHVEGIEIYPWTNIHNVTVRPNSQEYSDALDEFRLKHEHAWEPRSGDEGLNFKYCSGCRVTDIELERIEQRRVDRARGLR